jgi:predicted MPP superfamily phosphohydrolase
LKAWPIVAIAVIQALLFLAHGFLHHTILAFWGAPGPLAAALLHYGLLALAFSFVAASLLAFRFSNPAVTVFYSLAAAWLGFLNFFFFAACLCWLTWYALLLAGLHVDPLHARPLIATVLFAVAALAGIYGLINARYLRIRRYAVRLSNLPAQWRGRTALVVSDLHLGPILGAGFSRRIAALAQRLQPDIIFIPGDVFDGTKIDPFRAVEPLAQLAPPFGIFFATGNHDEFGNIAEDTRALRAAGIRVLAGECVEVDGLQIIGIPYHVTTHLIQMRAALEHLHIDRSRPSILLNHSPNRLPLVEQAGVSLQLSGHTHGGQFLPFTWLTRSIFGEFTHGLHPFGSMQVCTSSGCGSWGPPLRVGSSSEVVLLTFV